MTCLTRPRLSRKGTLLLEETFIEAKNITLKDIILLKAYVHDFIALKD
jgi:hypothetical protein